VKIGISSRLFDAVQVVVSIPVPVHKT
jgi:hypothetical protein